VSPRKRTRSPSFISKDSARANTENARQATVRRNVRIVPG
jgi:hypothetical protein